MHGAVRQKLQRTGARARPPQELDRWVQTSEGAGEQGQRRVAPRNHQDATGTAEPGDGLTGVTITTGARTGVTTTTTRACTGVTTTTTGARTGTGTHTGTGTGTGARIRTGITTTITTGARTGTGTGGIATSATTAATATTATTFGIGTTPSPKVFGGRLQEPGGGAEPPHGSSISFEQERLGPPADAGQCHTAGPRPRRGTSRAGT